MLYFWQAGVSRIPNITSRPGQTDNLADSPGLADLSETILSKVLLVVFYTWKMPVGLALAPNTPRVSSEELLIHRSHHTCRNPFIFGREESWSLVNVFLFVNDFHHFWILTGTRSTTNKRILFLFSLVPDSFLPVFYCWPLPYVTQCQ